MRTHFWSAVLQIEEHGRSVNEVTCPSIEQAPRRRRPWAVQGVSARARQAPIADADQYHGQKDRRNQHKNFETKAEQKSDRQADEHYCHGASPFTILTPLSSLLSQPPFLLHPRRL